MSSRTRCSTILVASSAQDRLNRPSLPAVPMHPWEWPDHPWDRVHVNYAGPFMGQMSLIVIVAYSKWMEIEIIKSATAQNTIKHLRMMFARFGLPKVLVSDNGTCFISNDFSEFTSRNGINSTVYVLPPITPLPMVRQRGLCRPLS